MSKKKKDYIPTNKEKVEHICNYVSMLSFYYPELSIYELLDLYGEDVISDPWNKINLKFNELKNIAIDKQKVVSKINHYKIKDNVTKELLLSHLFREGGFMNEVEKPKLFYIANLIDDIELHIEINTNTLKFDDYDNVLILDDMCGQPYYPFYEKSDRVCPGVAKIREKYNEEMDKLCDFGILEKIK